MVLYAGVRLRNLAATNKQLVFILKAIIVLSLKLNLIGLSFSVLTSCTLIILQNYIHSPKRGKQF